MTWRLAGVITGVSVRASRLRPSPNLQDSAFVRRAFAHYFHYFAPRFQCWPQNHPRTMIGGYKERVACAPSISELSITSAFFFFSLRRKSFENFLFFVPICFYLLFFSFCLVSTFHFFGEFPSCRSFDSCVNVFRGNCVRKTGKSLVTQV